jgi:hypothetical protein
LKNKKLYRLFSKTAALKKPARQGYFHQSLLRLWGLLYLFLSGTITLKVIFYHFHNYIFKKYQTLNELFEKPYRSPFQHYRIAPLFLHLKQWRNANEAESLIQVQYATKPKNPE